MEPFYNYFAPTRGEAKIRIAAIAGYHRGLGLSVPRMELYMNPEDFTYHVRVHDILPAADVAIRRILGTVLRVIDSVQVQEVGA